MKKIALITENLGNGGASRAVMRLAEAYSQSNLQTYKFTLISNGQHASPPVPHLKPIFKLKSDLCRRIYCRLLYPNLLPAHYIYRPAHGNFLDYHKTFKDFDLLHLFWCQNFLSPLSILALKKPVVITFHDMWFLTGGCSYSYGCSEFTKKCLACPNASSFFRAFINRQACDKRALIDSDKTRLIFTSEWMYDIAVSAGIDKAKCYVLNNIFPRHYRAYDCKYAFRQILSYSESDIHKYIIYFVGDINDPRKGFSLLANAIASLPKDLKDNLLLQVLGAHSISDSIIRLMDISVKLLGIYNDDVSQVLAYNAADLLICPSHYDNSPNVVAEANLCGIQVVCLDNTGTASMISKYSLLGHIISSETFNNDFFFLINDIINSKKIDRKGIASLASSIYSIDPIVNQHLHIYNTLL